MEFWVHCCRRCSAICRLYLLRLPTSSGCTVSSKCVSESSSARVACFLRVVGLGVSHLGGCICVSDAASMNPMAFSSSSIFVSASVSWCSAWSRWRLVLLRVMRSGSSSLWVLLSSSLMLTDAFSSSVASYGGVGDWDVTFF